MGLSGFYLGFLFGGRSSGEVETKGGGEGRKILTFKLPQNKLESIFILNYQVHKSKQNFQITTACNFREESSKVLGEAGKFWGEASPCTLLDRPWRLYN